LTGVKAGTRRDARMSRGVLSRVALPEAPMSEHRILDARGLEPPEPLGRVVDMIAGLREGDTLKLLIDQEPRLLYPILERSGYGHRTEEGLHSVFEVTIWPRAA